MEDDLDFGLVAWTFFLEADDLLVYFVVWGGLDLLS